MQKQFFRVLQLFAWRIRKSYSFSEKDLKHGINLENNLFGRSRSCLYRLNNIFIYSYLKSSVWLLLVAATLPVTSTSCERSFSKMKLAKTFPRNSVTSERLRNTDLLSIERVRAEKICLDDFVDEFNSRHDNRRIKLHWVVI